MQHNYTYNLPRETFNILEETFGSKEKAEVFADTMEKFLKQIDDKAIFMITDKFENIRFQIRDDLVKIFVTREIFNARFDMLENKFDEKFKTIETKFDVIDNKFIMVEEKFEMVEEKFQMIEEKFQMIDEKFQMVGERFKVIDKNFGMIEERFKNLNFRLTILIALVILALTFANPAFVKLLEKLIF